GGEKPDARPGGAEELAMAALKTGRFADAERGFVAASAKPRATPLETIYEKNRLRRLAGEAAAAAGDVKRAQELWKEADAGWNDASGATLGPRIRAHAHTEIRRL